MNNATTPAVTEFRGGVVYVTYCPDGSDTSEAAKLRTAAARCATEHGRVLTSGGVLLTAAGNRSRIGFSTVPADGDDSSAGGRPTPNV